MAYDWTPPLPELAGARHTLVEAGGSRLHVAEIGPQDAPPLVLLHGWPQHWWCWRAVAPQLADEYRCLLVDLPGYGWSDPPASGFGKDRLADQVCALLDALELDRPGLLGHDWGAFLGFVIALRRPDRLGALLALSIPHPWPSLHDRLNPRRLAAFAYQLPLSAPLLGAALSRGGVTGRVLRLASRRDTFEEEDVAAYEATMATGQGARATVQTYRTFLLRDLPGLLARGLGGRDLEIAARLVVGERDPIIAGADLRGHERHAPRLEIELVPGAAHFLPEECPELVAERARRLFAQLPR